MGWYGKVDIFRLGGDRRTTKLETWTFPMRIPSFQWLSSWDLLIFYSTIAKFCMIIRWDAERLTGNSFQEQTFYKAKIIKTLVWYLNEIYREPTGNNTLLDRWKFSTFEAEHLWFWLQLLQLFLSEYHLWVIIHKVNTTQS